jgi:hypothetical protein
LILTLTGPKLKVIKNGRTIIVNQEIPGQTGFALDIREDKPGPIYLQGSEKGRVIIRYITIVPAK